MNLTVKDYRKMAKKSATYLKEANYLGCFSCMTVFNKDFVEIVQDDNEQILCCPYCGSQTILANNQVQDEYLIGGLLNEINAALPKRGRKKS